MSSAEEEAAVVVDEAGTDTEAEEQNVSAAQGPPAAAPPVPASPQPARTASPIRAAAVPAAAAPTVSPKRKSSVGFIRPAEKLHVQARDPETAVLLKALQDVYNTKLKPVEELWSFNHYHQDAMTTADLEAKPQVLLLGQYSTGKTSFIRYMLGRDFPGMHIGPEPSTEAFQAVVGGAGDFVIPGTAQCIATELPFAGLSKFGAAFLNHFEASVCKSELLEQLTFIDTPGVLAGGNSKDRGYSFPAVASWFADRSDMILLVFDAHKLDISDEFRDLIQAISAHTDKIRIVLNKAQEVDADRLIKASQSYSVYGALMWGIGRSFKHKSEVPKVYVGSFWDACTSSIDQAVLSCTSMFSRHDSRLLVWPSAASRCLSIRYSFCKHYTRASPPDDTTATEDEEALKKEMLLLPNNVGLRRINDMMKRAKLVKVHACLLDYLHGQMPWLYGHEAQQAYLLEHLEASFEAVKRIYGFPDGDMPNVELYRHTVACYYRTHSFVTCNTYYIACALPASLCLTPCCGARILKLHSLYLYAYINMCCVHCHRRKLAGCDFRELPKLSRSMIRALDDLVDKDIRDVIMKNGGVKRIFKVSSEVKTASSSSRKSSTARRSSTASRRSSSSPLAALRSGGGMTWWDFGMVFVIGIVVFALSQSELGANALQSVLNNTKKHV
eukprot:21365-Heterococcus_DN1.PRE.2